MKNAVIYARYCQAPNIITTPALTAEKGPARIM